jgi:hypothetical protein
MLLVYTFCAVAFFVILYLVILYLVIQVYFNSVCFMVEHVCHVPVAARSKAWVCGRSPAKTIGSNPTRGRDVRLL